MNCPPIFVSHSLRFLFVRGFCLFNIAFHNDASFLFNLNDSIFVRRRSLRFCFVKLLSHFDDSIVDILFCLAGQLPEEERNASQEHHQAVEYRIEEQHQDLCFSRLIRIRH